jgi:hypothetical protein
MSMARPALRVAEYNLLAFQKSWKSAVMLYVVSPVLFLSAMGLGLGGLVASGRGSVAGVSYLRRHLPDHEPPALEPHLRGDAQHTVARPGRARR